MTGPLSSARRIILKVGSALICEDGRARADWLASLAGDVAALMTGGKNVILVSSGAIALGRAALGRVSLGKLEEKQAAAAFGQSQLVRALEAAFAPHGLPVAQALITLEDTERRKRWLNARATLETILAAGGVPVINENDTVATEEIRYGDNDRLAARVAQMLMADVLVLLSDVDGLYTGDPHRDPTARHIPVIEQLTPDHGAMARGANAKSGLGTGGMETKLAAAKIAVNAGCTTIIANGRTDEPLSALTAGARHTVIPAQLSPLDARRQWLTGNLDPEGEISIDAGAVRALRGGASLLPVGVSAVSGVFDRGAAIAICDSEKRQVAKGVTAYSAQDIASIMGLHTTAVEEKLGYRGRPAIVHRDDLVLAP
ncbi:MAG: glutamate 5-kinase [Pseudomonadota bacterium]